MPKTDAADQETRKIRIFIGDDGNFQAVKNTVTDTIGIPTRRASRIEPRNKFLRFLFRAIRSRVSDKSLWAEFTRIWPCRWDVTIGEKNYGPFRRRKEAINFEIGELENGYEKSQGQNESKPVDVSRS